MTETEKQKNNISSQQVEALGEKSKAKLTCVKCLGVFDEDLEFCPHCKCPALWSKPEFKQARKEQAATRKPEQDFAYQKPASPKKILAKRDFTKPLLVLAVLIVVGLSVYYFVDKEQNQPTAEEVAAMELVQNSQVLEAGTTVKELFAELDQATYEYVRVLGWRAKQVEGSLYFVSYVVDNDMSDGNGNQQYFFEVDIASGRVAAENDQLTAKYRALGYLK